MLSRIKNSTTPFLFYAVCVIALFRLVLLGAIPLLDKTEARYAEIARLMTETGNWTILQIDYGVPFWAKPPLSTWLSAISFEALGVSEFTARLPIYLLNIAVIIFLGKSLKKEGIAAWLLAFILLTTPEFLLHTGVVSTDTALSAAITLAMIAFWKAMQENAKKYWGYLFFVGIGLGLLAKGPIAIILTGPPVFIWLLLKKKRFGQMFRRIPWLLGIPLTALVAVPWYLLAEKESPGFIDYFIVGEHFKRFLEPGWTGDLYGGPKSQALGMIWVFLLAFAFPWVQFVLYKFWRQRKSIWKDAWLSFLFLWFLSALFFFTFSKNILHTYMLPSMVPMAILAAHWWKAYSRKKLMTVLASIFPAAAIIGFLALLFSVGMNNKFMNSDKFLVLGQGLNDSANEVPVYYFIRESYSGNFYTQGRADLIVNHFQLGTRLEEHNSLYLIVPDKLEGEIPQEYRDRMTLKDTNNKASIYLIR